MIRWETPPRRLTRHPGRFYSYAPSVIADGPTLYAYWCQNERDGVFRDTIYFGDADARGDTPFVALRPVFVAGPTGAWDAFHVCDPSVVAGPFRFEGRSYAFALFYLGNDVDASRHNQIGLAFAERREGPWIRCPEPVVSHGDTHAWGVGQPSAIHRDGNGRVQLFYTQGDRDGTRLRLREIDLTGDHPTGGPDVTLPLLGLTRRDGTRETVLHNADLACDPAGRRFWIVREQHPHPTDNPRFIGDSVQIATIDADEARQGRGSWQVVGEITPEVTGLARNHNAGWVRTAMGHLPDPRSVAVCFASASVVPDRQRAEWSYDLYLLRGQVQ